MLCFAILVKTKVLTLLILETEYSGIGVNAIPADALVTQVARASAGMVLLA